MGRPTPDLEPKPGRFTRRTGLKAGAALAGAAALDSVGLPIVAAVPAESPESQIIPLVQSFRLPDGTKAIFDRRANGMGDNPATNTDLRGYLMSGPMLNVYESNGGDAVWGPVISQGFTDALGRKTQYTQRGGFQITVDRQGAVENTEYDNIFDGLREAEVNLDDEENMIPKYADWSSDSNFKWGRDENGGLPGTIEENHIQKIFDQPQPNIAPREQALLKDKYLSNKKWFEQFGLPMGIKKYVNGVVAVVAQRAAFHLWPDATPWSRKDEPVVVLGGDVLKKLVLQGIVTKYVAKQVFQTQENPFPQGGGTVEAAKTVTLPELPGMIFQEVQSGKGEKTEWKVLKEVNAPASNEVTKPKEVGAATDKYLPTHNAKELRLVWLPNSIQEINGQKMRLESINIALGEGIFKGVGTNVYIENSQGVITVYHSVLDEDQIKAIKETPKRLENYTRGIVQTAVDLGIYSGATFGVPGRTIPADLNQLAFGTAIDPQPGIIVSFS